jgi:methylene-tetrahydromethanopterin dehydrogenase
MIQDAIFCRPPKHFNETGIFIGGRDVNLAKDMFQNAKNAMIAPTVGVFADPYVAYTASASIVALVEKVLQDQTRQGLTGRQVAVLGTGPVGLCTAILATQQGARVSLCQLIADDNERATLQFCDR